MDRPFAIAHLICQPGFRDQLAPSDHRCSAEQIWKRMDMLALFALVPGTLLNRFGSKMNATWDAALPILSSNAVAWREIRACAMVPSILSHVLLPLGQGQIAVGAEASPRAPGIGVDVP
jgi:hypothetical protein